MPTLLRWLTTRVIVFWFLWSAYGSPGDVVWSPMGSDVFSSKADCEQEIQKQRRLGIYRASVCLPEGEKPKGKVMEPKK
jgi:hypothetical protein